MIQLGICTSLDHAEAMRRMGYDYIELGMAATAALPEPAFAALCAAVQASPLPVEAMNVMLPGATYPLCAPDLDTAALDAYLETAFARAERLGVRVVVFGSGGARKRLEGQSEADAYDCLAAYLRRAAPVAAAHGCQIAIEPLRAQECNILHTVDEGRKLRALAPDPAVGVLADLYHMAAGNEGFEGMRRGPLLHTHIAEAKQRKYPRAGDGSEALYRGFFDALLHIGYEGRVSIEGGCDAFDADAAAAFALLDALRR